MKKTLTNLGVVFASFAFAIPMIASASVVYNAVPASLAPNYPSQPFQAQQTNEFGDYIHLGGTDRQLTTVTVTMSDWALESTPANQTFCTTSGSNCDSAGFDWPITVNIYANSLTNDVPNTLLGTKTVVTHIPWRPEADPTCAGGTAWRGPDDQCYNGFAFNATFDLSDLNLTLPNDVIVGFVYNTQTYGPNPTGVDGPYNSLNIAVPTNNNVSTGTDDSASEVFWNTETESYYSNNNCPGNTFCKDINWSPNGTVAMQINAISPAPVSCPAGTTQSSVAMETVTVQANSAADTLSTNVLANGTKYLLKAYGTANAGDGIQFDARYSFRTPTSVVWTDAVSTYEGLGVQLLDLSFNGSTPWGSFNNSHEYIALVNGNGSQAHFLVNDAYYPNNTGELKVDIFSCMPNVKYATGGGNLKSGKTVTWTFGGNVWSDTNGNPQGQFEVVNHSTKTSYHFDTITSINGSGNTVTFTATGTQQGKIKSPVSTTFTVVDNGEPGKTDNLTVTGGISLNATPISGGNFQVLVQ